MNQKLKELLDRLNYPGSVICPDDLFFLAAHDATVASFVQMWKMGSLPWDAMIFRLAMAQTVHAFSLREALCKKIEREPVPYIFQQPKEGA